MGEEAGNRSCACSGRLCFFVVVVFCVNCQVYGVRLKQREVTLFSDRPHSHCLRSESDQVAPSVSERQHFKDVLVL